VRSTISVPSTTSLSSPAFSKRRISFLDKVWSRKRDPIPIDALTEEFLKKKPKQVAQKPPELGGLSDSSIFQDEEVVGSEEVKPLPGGPAARAPPRDPKNAAAVLDPRPNARRRWETKMVIREIEKRGRLTKTQELKQKERELLSKSHCFKTSTKKLMHLARQISGKPVDEAILQMRFSAKKAAKDVKYHLEFARNEAIVRRGMGLGKVQGETGPVVNIQTKDGKRLKIDDKTKLYIDQAWVNKGQYGTTPDYRARGRVNRMKNPTTSITVILKEEATRIRLHQEREAKEERRKPWTQLPNRPITAQRQYYSW